MIRLSVILILIGILSGCGTTEYKTFEGNNSVIVGKGGTKESINGIDFWDNGEPPRKFQIIGVIEDERSNGIITMAQMKSDIAKKAKDAGGDAVVLLGSSSEVVGMVTSMNAYGSHYGNYSNASGFATSHIRKNNNSKFAVVKYLN